ncbi:Ger(x)C family spore germination protein [Acetivibrio cellulolyticus]|uniref:Ger(x)C family spore germination protein n=1 Tax=Acetivibrio cellulolyticus TaxID=35830 RepID=UPI0001E2C1B3|nr:Ger(x)C family spore germination protein [Acetivibrio cellulolyticus]
MRKIKIFMMAMMVLVYLICFTGCWNYREIDKFAIVAGVAVDKSKDGQYLITPEIVDISGGRETKITSKIISIEGKTIFDAVRNLISVLGKKPFWSHTKVLVLSKEVASENVNNIIDWYMRDAETREDVNILISETESARKIFEGQSISEEIKSYNMDAILKNQVSLSKAPVKDVLHFNIESKAEGVSAILPAINIKQIDGKMAPQIFGTAIIKNGKLVGFLSGEETQVLLFIRNEIKGGVLVEGAQKESVNSPASLEIFKSKTKVTPIVDGKQIEINLNVDTTVAIDEIDGTENYIAEEGRTKLEQTAANTLKEQIESLIKKIQQEYAADIFRFETKLHQDNPKTWKLVSSNWEEIFKDLKVNVQTKVHIKNSAVISKSVQEGD